MSKTTHTEAEQLAMRKARDKRNQRAYRTRKAARGLKELRGIWLPEADHGEVSDFADEVLRRGK